MNLRWIGDDKRLSLLEVDKLDIEDEGGVLGDDSWDAGSAISVGSGAGEGSLLALLELSDTFVPALDDLAYTDNEVERVSSLDRGVENGAVGEATGVVHEHLSALGAHIASALVVLNDGE